MLPGPVIMSTAASSAPPPDHSRLSGDDAERSDEEEADHSLVSVPPYASNATACAPPTAHTSSTPSSRAAARMVGCGSPSKAACGGLAMTRESTPAVCAGTTFITTLDG